MVVNRFLGKDGDTLKERLRREAARRDAEEQENHKPAAHSEHLPERTGVEGTGLGSRGGLSVRLDSFGNKGPEGRVMTTARSGVAEIRHERVSDLFIKK